MRENIDPFWVGAEYRFAPSFPRCRSKRSIGPSTRASLSTDVRTSNPDAISPFRYLCKSVLIFLLSGRLDPIQQFFASPCIENSELHDADEIVGVDLAEGSLHHGRQ